MKRYEHFCSYDGGGRAKEEETVVGDWVRYEDTVAAVAAERERCALEAEHWQRLSTAPGHACGQYIAAVIRGPTKRFDASIGLTPINDLVELEDGTVVHKDDAPAATHGTDTDRVMSAVWALVRSAPNFDGRQQHVAAAIDAAIVRAVETERARWAKSRRFAGWFTEAQSGMSYRLWEQGGHDQEPGYVALYEA